MKKNKQKKGEGLADGLNIEAIKNGFKDCSVNPKQTYDDVRNKIALAIMIKNEEKRICVSFDTMKDISDTFIVFDTGSTDRTIEVVKEYCEKNKIKLYLKQGEFVNFCESRNVLLDYADEVLKTSDGKPDKRYLVLLDCNDEVRNHEEIATFVRNHKGKQTGFHLKQQWWTGVSLDTYFNIRMVLSHSRWRYKGVVHEYICQTGKNDAESIMKLDNITLYQDRTVDDDKSQKRFKRDYDLLYTEHQKDPHEPRTIFYLAQTCGCLSLLTEAYQYYILRTKEEGFIEEQYHSYYRLGELSRNLGHPWEESLNWYIKAFGHSQRVEPLCRIAEYYLTQNYKKENKEEWMTAYLFISTACKLMYPHNQILFVNRKDYLYTRWHLMGRIGYYVGRYKEGKEGCIRALQFEENETDYSNLIFYLKQEPETKQMIQTQKFSFKALIGISLDQGEIYPTTEEGAGFMTTKISKEEVLKRTIQRMMKKK